MYKANCETLKPGSVLKYRFLSGGKPLAYQDGMGLLQNDAVFRSLLIEQLRESPFSAFKWETPPVFSGNKNQPFEFVLVNSPGLARPPDTAVFSEYFTSNENDSGVLTIKNLGGDALMIVPAPLTKPKAYTHLGEFVRHAPDSQIHSLWQCVGFNVEQLISHKPLWLNTAGGGVAWLHVRLDSRPKYYAHIPYKKSPV